METHTIRVDGVEIKVDAATASFVEKALRDRDDKITAAEKRADEAEGKLDAATTELTEAKTKLDAASDPKRFAEAVTARGTLEKGARKVLGLEAKFDGKTDREVMVAVVVKTDDKFDPKDRSDDYVAARFDQIVAVAPEPNGRRSVARAIAKGRQPDAERQDANDDPNDESRVDGAESAKARARRQAAEMGQKRLRVSIG